MDTRQLTYKPGAILPGETAGMVGSEQRTTEYKRLDCPILKMEKPFIERCAQFIIGCLNARVYGTIYFGVADNKANEGNLHGEIMGITVEVQDRHKIHEYFEDNLNGIAPKMLKGASQKYIRDLSNCVLPPIFIPIKGNPSKVVIEIDVHPRVSNCGSTKFWLSENSKKGSRRYFTREGTSTREINMSVKKDRDFLEDFVKKNSQTLSEWEKRVVQARQIGPRFSRWQMSLFLPIEELAVKLGASGALDGPMENMATLLEKCRRNDVFERMGSLKIKSSKHWTTSEQIEYKEKVKTSGDETIIYEPKDGDFTRWIGFSPLKIDKYDGIKALSVIRPDLKKQDLIPNANSLDCITRDFEKQQAKGDHAITPEFLSQLGLKYCFTSGKILRIITCTISS